MTLETILISITVSALTSLIVEHVSKAFRNRGVSHAPNTAND